MLDCATDHATSGDDTAASDDATSDDAATDDSTSDGASDHTLPHLSVGGPGPGNPPSNPPARARRTSWRSPDLRLRFRSVLSQSRSRQQARAPDVGQEASEDDENQAEA